jgi:hypothetical protein
MFWCVCLRPCASKRSLLSHARSCAPALEARSPMAAWLAGMVRHGLESDRMGHINVFRIRPIELGPTPKGGKRK